MMERKALRRTAQLMLLSFVATVVVSTAKKHHPTCSPSSCGKIQNISYPFRLKGDPRHCGDTRYELGCENNLTVLSLGSGKYHVQHISYSNYQIRVSDAGLEGDACSVNIPRHFISWYYYFGPTHLNLVSRQEIAYLNCSNPVSDDPQYVAVDYSSSSSCAEVKGHSGSDSGGGGHVYVVGGMDVKDVRVGCQLMAATLARDVPCWYCNNSDNVSYSDIHKSLVNGFELSWLPVVCENRCGKHTDCHRNETTGQVQCENSCYYASQTASKCGITFSILIRYAQAFLRGILIGIDVVITLGTKEIGDSEDSPLIYFIGKMIALFILPSLVAARFLFGVILLTLLFIYKWRRRHLSVYESIENFLQDSNLNPISYSYKEIKKMTRGFKVKLGEGGFGCVYKGSLRSGPIVAIKMLGKSKTNGQDFISEVATIGRIHHVNVVRLIGYCAEGTKRALVYEFMPNGSLDKYIFCRELSIPLSYEKIYEISLGVARGIAYLHQGCDMQILHFDIKPYNILLDDNFTPKVSDFGLAKLYPVNNSIVTLTAARGTIGYMAPELFYKNIGGVSYKADVYSFGMLLMEMASRRKNLNPHAEHSSELYFPLWIYDQFSEEKDIEMEDVTEEEKNLAKKMFIIALWCIQLKPNDRPSMSKVVEMLEGEVESLEMPPKPSLYPNEVVAMNEGINSHQTASSASIGSSDYVSETSVVSLESRGL